MLRFTFFRGMAETASGEMVIRAIQKLVGEKGIALGSKPNHPID
jgi:hypothetical protein